jgi:hypothetical protein
LKVKRVTSTVLTTYLEGVGNVDGLRGGKCGCVKGWEMGKG